jgi:hypothetical protein
MALIALAAGPGFGACALMACELVDPASTLDKDWKGDGGGSAVDGGASDGPGVRCYADVIDEIAIFTYCPSGEVCCYPGSYLGTGRCQASSCANLSFKCSDQDECPPHQRCCAPGGLMGSYEVLQGSRCADACTAAGDLTLCDLQQSGVCPPGTTCQTNGMNNRPLGYDSCK